MVILRGLVEALQFSTRVPIPLNMEIKERHPTGIMKYLTLVGGMIGIIMGSLYGVLLKLDPFVAAVAVVISESLITGGLHQDGLADTFDGFYSNKDREGILKAMKDSRLGTHGVLALTGTLLLKVALINVLRRPGVLFVMPVISRLAMVYGATFSKSAKTSGLGFEVIDGTSYKDALIASLIALCIALWFMGPVLILGIMAVTLGLSLAFVKICTFRIGGMTGDTLGALGELAALAYLTVCGLLSFCTLGKGVIRILY